jgi:hypothetical protein
MRTFLKLLVYATVPALMLASCSNNTDADTPKPGTGDDIDVTVATTQSESQTLLTLTYKVYVKGKLAKTYTRVDTLPNLGLNVVPDTTFDANGDIESVKNDTTLNGYRLFITSK